jgi:hypothetical protein
MKQCCYLTGTLDHKTFDITQEFLELETKPLEVHLFLHGTLLVLVYSA